MLGRKLSCTLIFFLFCSLSFLGYLLAWARWLCLPRSHPRCGQPGILLLAGNRGSQRITAQTLHISDPSPLHSLLCEFLNVLIFLAGTASGHNKLHVFSTLCVKRQRPAQRVSSDDLPRTARGPPCICASSTERTKWEQQFHVYNQQSPLTDFIRFVELLNLVLEETSEIV